MQPGLDGGAGAGAGGGCGGLGVGVVGEGEVPEEALEVAADEDVHGWA